MITGYDHLLFLIGVIFYLFRLKDVALYVSLFAIGHSLTMVLGVWFKIGFNPYLIDSIIAFSVVYKSLDNLGAFPTWFGFQPNAKKATLLFGLLHGFGLATKIQDYNLSQEGLFGNLLSFNMGVELGQLAALSILLIFFGYWRKSPRFFSQSIPVNFIVMGLGFILLGLQLGGFFFTL